MVFLWSVPQAGLDAQSVTLDAHAQAPTDTEAPSTEDTEPEPEEAPAPSSEVLASGEPPGPAPEVDPYDSSEGIASGTSRQYFARSPAPASDRVDIAIPTFGTLNDITVS